MAFNYDYAECIGKLIFVLFDLMAIWILWKIINKTNNKLNDEENNNNQISQANFVAKLYGFNPLFVYLTVRGSC
jgi:hypothetical protein